MQWWGRIFVRGGRVGSNEDAVRQGQSRDIKAAGFSENDQTNLYMQVWYGASGYWRDQEQETGQSVVCSVPMGGLVVVCMLEWRIDSSVRQAGVAVGKMSCIQLATGACTSPTAAAAVKRMHCVAV
jgi:hypothetical protein